MPPAEIKTLHGHESLLIEFSDEGELQIFKEMETVKPLLKSSEENGREMILHSLEMGEVQYTMFSVLAEPGLCPIKNRYRRTKPGAIFKRFYWEEAVRDVDGIGIGLYLAREIITMQGGYILVSSGPDHGSIFSVFLPKR